MLFCIRSAKSRREQTSGQSKRQSYDYCNGTRIAPNGETTNISKENIKLSVVKTVTLDNRDYPSKWQVELPNTPAIIIESITKDSRNKLTIPIGKAELKLPGALMVKAMPR